jgi:hypothetical protein
MVNHQQRKRAMAEISKDEMTFMQRMLPHFIAGKSAEEAARAVLDDDARIMNAAMINRGQEFFSDTVGGHFVDRNPSATTIAKTLTQVVYERLRA